ncbi:MAG TPA: hypothetical protein VGL93_10895, partial [Streptosporangiaceae bacterium]
MSARRAGSRSPARRFVRIAARRTALDRNPLRPRIDRVRVWTGWLAVLVIAAVLPVVMPRVADWARQTGTRDARTSAVHRHPVRATVLRTARPLATMPTWTAAPEHSPAVWTAPDGRTRHADIEVDGYVPAGH